MSTTERVITTSLMYGTFCKVRLFFGLAWDNQISFGDKSVFECG